MPLLNVHASPCNSKMTTNVSNTMNFWGKCIYCKCKIKRLFPQKCLHLPKYNTQAWKPCLNRAFIRFYTQREYCSQAKNIQYQTILEKHSSYIWNAIIFTTNRWQQELNGFSWIIQTVSCSLYYFLVCFYSFYCCWQCRVGLPDGKPYNFGGEKTIERKKGIICLAVLLLPSNDCQTPIWYNA